MGFNLLSKAVKQPFDVFDLFSAFVGNAPKVFPIYLLVYQQLFPFDTYSAESIFCSYFFLEENFAILTSTLRE